MDINFVHHINYFAVAGAAFVYFIIGSIWYSPLLMSDMWIEELKHHQVTIKTPTSAALFGKMLITFTAALISAFAMACLVIMTSATTWQSGLLIGILSSMGFAGTTLATAFIWESRSFKLFLIDIGYPILGIISSAMLLSIWR